MGTGITLALRHSISRQEIEVRVAREAQAHALLQRVGALNRERLLPAIERVFDEFDRPGEVIRIDRLELDLGRIAEGRLGEVEARLADALRAALRRTVGTGASVFAPAQEQARIAPTRLVLAEAFGHFLDAGAWPYRCVLDAATRPADVFARLLDEAPEALAPMLHARRGREAALRRLVRQVPGPLLERLLGLLDPDNAHWILVYMAQTRAAHRAVPLIAAPPDDFARTLWFVVLRDALHRSGLRANRRAFVAELIAELAGSLGADPADLLRALLRGLAAAPPVALGDSSLLSILAEIARVGEDGVGAGFDFAAEGRKILGDPAAAFAALEQALQADAASSPAAIAAAAAVARRFGLAAARAGDRDSSRALLGALAADDPARLRRLLRASGGQAATGLLAGWEGEEAAGFEFAVEGRNILADPAAAFAALEQALQANAASSPAAIAAAAAVARRFGLAAARAGDRDSARALLGALAVDDPARLRRLLRASAASGGQAAAGLLAACDPEEAADLILPPHLASAVAGLIRIAGCAPAEREALLTAAAAIPPSAPAALAVADLAGLLASRRRTSEAALLARLQAAALAAGGETGRKLAALLNEARVPAGPAQTGAVRRELALETLRALLAGRLVGPPGEQAEAGLAALAGGGAEAIRREIGVDGLRPRVAGAALSRLSPRALLRLVALLAPAGVARKDVRAALAEAGGDRARLAALAAWLIVGGAAPPTTPRLAVEARDLAWRSPAPASRGRARSARALFFLLRHDPAAVLGPLSTAGPGSADLALLFSRLPDADRRDAEAMARRLSGPGARRALDTGLIIASLLAAVREALTRRGWGSFAGLWRAALAAAASPAEQAVLDRLLPPPNRRGEALRRLRNPPEPGSAAWLFALLDAPADEARDGLRLLRSAAFRRRLSRRLPRHLLARLLFAARPREARTLLESAHLVRGVFAAEGRSIAPEMYWEALLDSLRAPPGAALARLVERLIPLGAGAPAGLAAALLARARAARHGALAAAIEAHAAAAGQRKRKRLAARDAKAAGAPDRLPPGGEEADMIFVPNAGLVIAAPFLGPLCERTELAARAADGSLRWVEPEAAGRAVHLLQYLANGRTDAPEPLLALNKILCGLDPAWPSLAAIELTVLERETCDSLIGSILALWPGLSGSSAAALRETFFQREGRLSRADPGWTLEVERKTLDVLLDTLPWSFTTILTPWMPHPLSVTW
ncbi:MAG TPA: contractile injection system tape measure protein [Allosphingosinicella sp.]